MKRVLSVLTAAGLALSLAACGNSASSAAPVESTAASSEAAGFDTTQAITVISREEGSGTRGAFEELTETKDVCAYNQELTSTGAVITAVASSENAIGYASLSAVEGQAGIKSLTVDGVACSEETVLDGSYKIQRPFNIVISDSQQPSDLVQAFIDFCTSADAADLIRSAGAVPLA